MRITFFTIQSIESPSGFGRYFPLAKELVKLGHSATILCLHHDINNAKEREYINEGVKIINVGQMSVLKKGDFKYYFNKFKLFKVVITSTLMMLLYGLKTETDIIYLCKPQPVNSTAALITKFIKNKKLILDCDDYEAKSNNFSNKIEEKVFQLFEDNVPRFSDAITSNTIFLTNRIIKLGYPKDKILYFPNGIETERFKVDKKKLFQLKKKLKIGKNKVVLYFGSMDLRTGHAIDHLLRSFKLVKKQMPKSKLILIGGGTDIEKLKNLSEHLGLKNDVSFLGKVSSSLISTYIKLGDVSVDPVNNNLGCEGRSPLKIFESMYMKIIVVTGSLIDRDYIMGKGKYGYTVIPGDDESLKEGILRALNDKESKKKVELAFEHVKKYYWPNSARRFNKILYKVARG